jgi:hypothetical protein
MSSVQELDPSMSISVEQAVARHAQATAEFDVHEKRRGGLQVANSLAYGLNNLRKSLFTRIHDDVERYFGMDSSVTPVSERKVETKVKIEIELYQIAVSAAEVRSRGYLSTDDDWYLSWLERLRLGSAASEAKVQSRLANYLNATARSSTASIASTASSSR